MSTTMSIIKDLHYLDISKSENHKVFMKGAKLRAYVLLEQTERPTALFVYFKERRHRDKLLVCEQSTVRKK